MLHIWRSGCSPVFAVIINPNVVSSPVTMALPSQPEQNLKDYNLQIVPSQSSMKDEAMNAWAHQTDEIRDGRATEHFSSRAFPQWMLFTDCGVSYVRYSFIIWLPTSCALFPNPAAWRTQALVSAVRGPTQGWILPLLYHTACLIKSTEGKQHHTEEFKDHIAEEATECISSTIQCLQRTRCHNSNHYTMDHNCSVKFQAQKEVRSTKACLKNKRRFFGSFCLQRLAGTQSGPMGISTFLPNKEQGFHVRNWATAMDQLTSLNPFILSFHCLPGKHSLTLHQFKQAFVKQYLAKGFWHNALPCEE